MPLSQTRVLAQEEREHLIQVAASMHYLNQLSATDIVAQAALITYATGGQRDEILAVAASIRDHAQRLGPADPGAAAPFGMQVPAPRATVFSRDSPPHSAPAGRILTTRTLGARRAS